MSFPQTCSRDLLSAGPDAGPADPSLLRPPASGVTHTTEREERYAKAIGVLDLTTAEPTYTALGH